MLLVEREPEATVELYPAHCMHLDLIQIRELECAKTCIQQGTVHRFLRNSGGNTRILSEYIRGAGIQDRLLDYGARDSAQVVVHLATLDLSMPRYWATRVCVAK